MDNNMETTTTKYGKTMARIKNIKGKLRKRDMRAKVLKFFPFQ